MWWKWDFLQHQIPAAWKKPLINTGASYECLNAGLMRYQGDFNCGASSQADFILNYFLSNFLKFPLKFSISSQPSWQAGTIKATLEGGNARKNLLHKVGRREIATYLKRGKVYIKFRGWQWQNVKQTCSNWTGRAFLSCHLNVIRQLILHKQVDHKKTFVVVYNTKSESEF